MTAHYRHLRNIDGSVVCGGEQMRGYPGDDVRPCSKCLRRLCSEKVCLCCVCCLRESAEFGAAFSPDDECCEGCHGDMAAPHWPGTKCGS